MIRFCIVLWVTLGWAWILPAQTTEVARVVDSAGGWMSNASAMVISAVAQPGPVGYVSNATHLNYSGFLNAFLLFPQADADGDGVADENDPDDDNDGLTDLVELRGSAFDPATATDPLRADTDGDGQTDLEEAVAGTNPADAASRLRILALQLDENVWKVTWQSRKGRLYALLAAASMAEMGIQATTVTTARATSGTGSWEEGATVGTDEAGPSLRFYRVRVLDR